MSPLIRCQSDHRKSPRPRTVCHHAVWDDSTVPGGVCPDQGDDLCLIRARNSPRDYRTLEKVLPRLRSYSDLLISDRLTRLRNIGVGLQLGRHQSSRRNILRVIGTVRDLSPLTSVTVILTDTGRCCYLCKLLRGCMNHNRSSCERAATSITKQWPFDC